MYLIGFSIMSLPAAECYGWKCEVVHCVDGYAVYIPEMDKYLPCHKFDEFIETDNKELLR